MHLLSIIIPVGWNHTSRQNLLRLGISILIFPLLSAIAALARRARPDLESVLHCGSINLSGMTEQPSYWAWAALMRLILEPVTWPVTPLHQIPTTPCPRPATVLYALCALHSIWRYHRPGSGHRCEKKYAVVIPGGTACHARAGTRRLGWLDGVGGDRWSIRHNGVYEKKWRWEAVAVRTMSPRS